MYFDRSELGSLRSSCIIYVNENGHYCMQSVRMRDIIIKSCMECFVNRDICAIVEI